MHCATTSQYIQGSQVSDSDSAPPASHVSCVILGPGNTGQLTSLSVFANYCPFQFIYT